METENPILPVAASPDVQHVTAVRAEGVESAVATLGERTTQVLTTGASTFFSTIKRMMLLVVILAMAAAWWAEQGAILRGVAAILLVLIPGAVLSLVLAGQRAAAAVAAETWRQTGLARRLLDLLLDQVAATPSETMPDTPPGRLPIAEACARLKRAVTNWKTGTSTSSSLIRRSQEWVAGLMERVVAAHFQTYVGKGGVEINEARQDLAERIDDLVAARVRRRTLAATIGVVILTIVWAVLVAYFLRRLSE
jgi:hypothetical protein